MEETKKANSDFSQKFNFDFMLSPVTVISGMVLGFIIGLFFKDVVPYIEPFGELYLSILKMSVIPILAAAIITSVGRLIQSEQSGNFVRKLILLFIIFLIGVSIISIIISLVAKPLLAIDTQTQRVIGQLTMNEEDDTEILQPGSNIKRINSSQPPAQEENNFLLLEFILGIIPHNIFASLSKGSTLQVIFFFIVLGILMKYILPETRDNMIMLFEGIFIAFQKLIKFTMYFLPLGLVALVSSQVAAIGFSTLTSLLKFVILLYIIGFVIFILSTVIIYLYGTKGYGEQFKALGETIMIALGTRNSFAAVPAAMEGLQQNLGFNKELINSSLPLGVTICRYGNVMVFSAGAIFAARLYGFQLGLSELAIVGITSVLAAMAASGAPGLIARTMISLVLEPLGIPPAATIALLIAINPVIDPMTTVINVYPNLALASIFASDRQGFLDNIGFSANEVRENM